MCVVGLHSQGTQVTFLPQIPLGHSGKKSNAYKSQEVKQNDWGTVGELMKKAGFVAITKKKYPL